MTIKKNISVVTMLGVCSVVLMSQPTLAAPPSNNPSACGTSATYPEPVNCSLGATGTFIYYFPENYNNNLQPPTNPVQSGVLFNPALPYSSYANYSLFMKVKVSISAGCAGLFPPGMQYCSNSSGSNTCNFTVIASKKSMSTPRCTVTFVNNSYYKYTGSHPDKHQSTLPGKVIMSYSPQ